MKNLLVLFIAFSHFICFSQDAKDEFSKLTIGLNASINSSNFAHRNIEDGFESVINWIRNTTSPALGLNTGLSVQYQLSKRFALESGMQYARHSSDRAFKVFTMSNTGLATNEKAEFKIRFDYIEIPFKLNYKLVDKDLFLYLTGGISVNIFMKDQSTQYVTYADGFTFVSHEEYISNIDRKTATAVLAGLGVGYNFLPRFSVRAEPLFRYTVQSLVKPVVIAIQNYSYGLQTGLYVDLF